MDWSTVAVYAYILTHFELVLGKYVFESLLLPAVTGASQGNKVF